MARLPRNVLPPEGVYHLTARGVERRRIYLDDDDHRTFLALFAWVVDRYEWRCHAFCLMPNHYHLVVEAFLAHVSAGMRRLNGVYAQQFNGRHRRWGHLFGERFAAWVVRDDDHLEQACLYVLDNPVRAGLCADAADWPWSGYRAA
jgi:putative transposase